MKKLYKRLIFRISRGILFLTLRSREYFKVDTVFENFKFHKISILIQKFLNYNLIKPVHSTVSRKIKRFEYISLVCNSRKKLENLSHLRFNSVQFKFKKVQVAH